MASPGIRSTSSLMPGRILVAFDATKSLHSHELKHIISNIQMQQNMIQEVDTITVLGVLHKVLHPMGFQMQIEPDSFIGTRVRAIKEETSRMVDAYVGKLQSSAEECEGSGVVIEVKIVVGAPLKNVIVQEAIASNATWVVLMRHLQKELRFYLKQIPCKVAQTLDNFSLKILRPSYSDKARSKVEHESLYTLSKLVPAIPSQYTPSNDHTDLISPIHHGSTSTSSRGSFGSDKSSLASTLTSKSKEQSIFSPYEFTSNPHGEKQDTDERVVKESDASTRKQKQTNVQVDSKGWNYSEIKTATSNFSSENLLREDEYGLVYKGRLMDGKLVSVRVQKEGNAQQGFSEVDVPKLCVACHKNVVMLLGYCRGENIDVLVYEYIADRSLEWHLFDDTEHVLAWSQRCSIAVGVAKGLRFLHEECRGSPILHRDVRPSNILLTREFVPLLANCGLANKHERSAKTDVFAFGMTLIQLISGHRGDNLREWAVTLIETLRLDELVDHRLRDSYGTYELYRMARLAYLCIQIEPAMRPTVGEVLLVLEGENDHLEQLTQQLTPVPNDVQRRLYPRAL